MNLIKDSDCEMPTTELKEFFDRDLSWLEFNRRVLHEALDSRNPLLDRLLFLGIFTSNLDEFFMKRVPAIDSSVDAAAAVHRLENLRAVILPMLEDQSRCFREELRPELAAHGIRLLQWQELSDQERSEVNGYFRQNVFPVMTPLAVDPSHPFPFISNLSDSLVVALRYPDDERRYFARIKIPSQIPQWIEVTSAKEGSHERRFASIREIILHNLAALFPGMEIDDVLPIRVTRGAGAEGDAALGDDLLEQVEEELRQRRFQQVVRLEHGARPNPWLLEQVVRNLGLAPQQVFEIPGELDYTDFMSIATLRADGLRYPTWTPVVPPAFADPAADILSVIRAGDVLVHHPYESFDASVARFIRAAVEDDNVMAIKMTLYRTSDDTPFVPLLIEAAEAGKQVACLIELNARFDEQRNIRWANALEDAGVHVVYGVIGMKTHTKTSLVVRREADGLRCYAHIGTGNYNPKTAKLYTDLGLFTADPAITEDIVELFHHLTGRSLKHDYRRLLVAPVNMKARFLELIEREIAAQRGGLPAAIVAKMNQLEDHDICRALYRASQAGVPIDLIVRGFCLLRPGVPELSPTIRVISVIGRFLEHSRIFYFRNGAASELDGEFYIGSADWMHRNLEERIEVITPVQHHELKHRLWHILQVLRNDQRQAWSLQSDGHYVQRMPAQDDASIAALGTHVALMRAF